MTAVGTEPAWLGCQLVIPVPAAGELESVTTQPAVHLPIALVPIHTPAGHHPHQHEVLVPGDHAGVQTWQLGLLDLHSQYLFSWTRRNNSIRSLDHPIGLLFPSGVA